MCLPLSGLKPILMFVGKARFFSYPSYFTLGQAPALPANIRLGRKVLRTINALAS